MHLLEAVSAFAAFVMPIAASYAAQTPDPAASVAVQETTIDDPGHEPIPVAIWSPAGPTDHGSGRDGATRTVPAEMHLIVISHGTGAALFAHIDTAQALARSGFVVVALQHPGDNFQDQNAVGRPEWFVNRSRHVSRVIDFMFTQWDGRARLVSNRVGIFGFSAGGTTALISIGGIPDLDRVPSHCAQQPEFVCTIMVSQATISGAGQPRWVHDRRIAAAVIAAPGLGFAFAPSGLTNVRVPVQLWAGAADRAVPYETNTGVVRRLLSGPVDFHNVPGAAHLSFLAPCGPETPPQLCQDGEGFDRIAFHRDFNQSMIEFFRAHLIIAGSQGDRARHP